ncbi:hypothetical protein WISP_121129 [Willisornis vidua]|uniref:Uncharacterized protein n=1 Tax=Willisornis vidua TaxID=1566151 RepID=A0ABQ9CSL0_9PASS|nr:hypothetical protein WISP_121129 [Willisornis vidua]
MVTFSKKGHFSAIAVLCCKDYHLEKTSVKTWTHFHCCERINHADVDTPVQGSKGQGAEDYKFAHTTVREKVVLSNDHVDNLEHSSKKKVLPCWREKAMPASPALSLQEEEQIFRVPGARGLMSLETGVSTQALIQCSCLELVLCVPMGVQPPPPNRTWGFSLSHPKSVSSQ